MILVGILQSAYVVNGNQSHRREKNENEWNRPVFCSGMIQGDERNDKIDRERQREGCV